MVDKGQFTADRNRDVHFALEMINSIIRLYDLIAGGYLLYNHEELATLHASLSDEIGTCLTGLQQAYQLQIAFDDQNLFLNITGKKLHDYEFQKLRFEVDQYRRALENMRGQDQQRNAEMGTAIHRYLRWWNRRQTRQRS